MSFGDAALLIDNLSCFSISVGTQECTHTCCPVWVGLRCCTLPFRLCSTILRQYEGVMRVHNFMGNSGGGIAVPAAGGSGRSGKKNKHADSDAHDGMSSLGGTDKATQRAAFLEFVTARPRLPSGGLHALPCTIRVQDPGSGGSGSTQRDIDQRLPTAHTCSLTLDLPSYSNKEILKQRLERALALMAEYEGLVD